MKKNYRSALNNFLILFFSVALVAQAAAQQEKPLLMFPIKPGVPNSLSANMGELRPNHFHGGYDVKTDAKIGYPVYASADGYVSRVKVSSYGYGNVVYITHPGNLQTVYAHLDKFNGPIGEYILKKQYEQQSFAVELFPSPAELPIRKGEVIGLAGNSGSSQGPHLHYEIRDTTDKVLNPSEFGFKEITDHLPPVFQKIALVPLDINARINGEFSRTELAAVKPKGSTVYTISSAVNVQGLIGIELKAQDKKNNSANTYGINYIQLQLDGQTVFTHDLSSFTFDQTRYINSHMNYPLYATTGKRFERLYADDGNILSTYSYVSPLKGRLHINDAKVHQVRIIIRDDFKNESILNFKIQGKPLLQPQIPPALLLGPFLSTDIQENTLKIYAKSAGNPGCTLSVRNQAVELSPVYLSKGFVTYLWDLRKGLPDTVRVGALRAGFNFVKMVPSGSEQKVSYQNVQVTIPKGAIADTVYFQMKSELSNGLPVYHIHNNVVPLYDSITIAITPLQPIQNKARTGVYFMNRGRANFEGGEWKGNKIEVKTRNLGKFTILEDTVKPNISLLSNFGNSIQFRISDNLSGIGDFRATLDGYWILMNYDHKRNLIWSERIDKTVPLKGEFILEVKDNAGNINKFTIKL